MKTPSNIRLLLAIIAAFNPILRSSAQDVTPAPRPSVPPTVTIEELIVTGSNIPTSEEVGPNPVDVYRRDDIERLGARTVTDLIQTLPAVAGAASNDYRTSGGDGRAEMNLRGLLPRETLILEDGRRLAPVGFAGESVDLNMFPIGLIDHLDVLKDGASAIYGPDAVAGVVNFWLIHRFHGLEIYASYANSNLGFANDAAEERAYLLAGTGDDKTDIVVYAEAYNRAAIFSRDANISHDADYRPFGGKELRSGNYAGRVDGRVYQPSLNNGSLTPTPHAYPDVRHDPEYVPLTSLPVERQFYNFADVTPAMAPVDREYLYGSFSRSICDTYLVAFADFKYVRTFWEGALAPAPFLPDIWTDATHPFGISGSQGSGSGISVPLQNAFNPFTVPNYVSPGGFDPRYPGTDVSAPPPGTAFVTGVRYRASEAGLRTDKITTDNYVFTTGLKGNLGEFGEYLKTWNWEAGFRYNEDSRVDLQSGVVNTSALRVALLDTDPATAFNPFGLNVNSKAVRDRVFATAHHSGTTTLELEDLKLTGGLVPLPASPLSFALGGEHRRETAHDEPDELVASGGTLGGLLPAGPTKGSRDVWTLYWEVRVPITSPIWNCPGFYSLELGYQERFENFSDLGSTERPKFFFRWQPLGQALTFRGTYSEAYHAPTLNNLFLSSESSFPVVFDPKTGALVQPQDIIAGNPGLRPETAYEWTYGAVVSPGKWWSPLEGLTILADFYHIDLRAVTLLLDSQFLLEHENEFPGLVIRGPPTPGNPFGPLIRIFTPQENLGRLIEEGWDYEIAYTFDTQRLGHGDWGKLTETFNGTYLDRAVLQAVPGGPEQNVVGKFGGGFLGTNGGGSFTHNRWYASLYYDGPSDSWLQGIDAGAVVHYIGQYWDNANFTPQAHKTAINGFPSNWDSSRKVREWVTLDVILNYTFNLPQRSIYNEIAGYSKNGGTTIRGSDGHEKNILPGSIAEYNPCGWHAWLNSLTVTVGVNNVLDQQPPFVAAAAENGYDESTANIKGRIWYLALKKRF